MIVDNHTVSTPFRNSSRANRPPTVRYRPRVSRRRRRRRLRPRRHGGRSQDSAGRLDTVHHGSVARTGVRRYGEHSVLGNNSRPGFGIRCPGRWVRFAQDTRLENVERNGLREDRILNALVLRVTFLRVFRLLFNLLLTSSPHTIDILIITGIYIQKYSCSER